MVLDYLGGPATARALRANGLELVGSGQGSVSLRDIVTELTALAAEIRSRTFEVGARSVPLASIESAWTDSSFGNDRLVFVP